MNNERTDTSICSCGERMHWVTHERTGKPAPIDPVPMPDGPITLNTGTDGHEVVSYHVLSKAEREAGVPAGVARYTNHFQTCPRASAYKRQGRA